MNEFRQPGKGADSCPSYHAVSFPTEWYESQGRDKPLGQLEWHVGPSRDSAEEVEKWLVDNGYTPDGIFFRKGEEVVGIRKTFFPASL
ncbi:MAG: hypothetical protein Q7R63_00355 [bacterium]|nr:hypothetical protein [bacterium]